MDVPMPCWLIYPVQAQLLLAPRIVGPLVQPHRRIRVSRSETFRENSFSKSALSCSGIVSKSISAARKRFTFVFLSFGIGASCTNRVTGEPVLRAFEPGVDSGKGPRGCVLGNASGGVRGAALWNALRRGSPAIIMTIWRRL